MTGGVEPGEPRSSANRGYSFSIPKAILMIWIWERSCGKDSRRCRGVGKPEEEFTHVTESKSIVKQCF